MAIHMHIFAYIHTHPQRFKYIQQTTNIVTYSYISTYINTFHTCADIHMLIAFTHIHKLHTSTHISISSHIHTHSNIFHT